MPMRRPRRLKELLLAAVAAGALACSTERADVPVSDPARIVPPAVDPAGAVPDTLSLPATAGDWQRTGVPRTVTRQGISEHMGGVGELYLAYRLVRLDVYEYVSTGQGTIRVEVFRLQHSDDAFGLLSNDWGGESLSLAREWARAPSVPGIPPHRALYGAGLLRMWCGRLYVRVLAPRESPAARQAVIEIGRAVASGQVAFPPPALLAALPASMPLRVRLRANRVRFLRSYLVLNSAYFLATENLLNLEETVEAVVAPYDALPSLAGRKPGQLLLVRYESADKAGRALAHFREAYLPESVRGAAGSSREATVSAHMENGWMAYRSSGRALALAFECRTREHAQLLVEEAIRRIESLERRSVE